MPPEALTFTTNTTCFLISTTSAKVAHPDEKTVEGTPETDFESVVIIEDSIRETEKLLKNSAYIKYYDEIDDDLQLLDKLLLDSGIDEIVRR